MRIWQRIKQYYPPYVDFIAMGMLIFAALYLALMYGQLPDEIPTHYNFTGEPDAWSGKISLVGLLILFVHLFAFTWLLNYFLCVAPKNWKNFIHLINVPTVKKDELNENQVKAMRIYIARMMASMNFLMSFIFAYIIFGTIQTALGRQNGLGWTPFVIVILLIIVCIHYCRQSIRVAKKTS
ncbi:DUF1648 domain-containing protein [Desulfofalx alkaliphila]|uniref:DUF1648 domain-containing protein n=1 Tax=Desulfofalx alkaliphila TaxID=105483 RepID=UPI0004E0F0AA|nr:DUF1648 domain-containing protein [Desulfofalx alkaliphila]